MKKSSITYHNFFLLKWFFTVAILLGVGGYSNYTSPNIQETTIELVIPLGEKPLKNACFQEGFKNIIDCCFLHQKNTALASLSLYHTKLSLTRTRSQDTTISSVKKLHIHSIHSTPYSSEEDSHRNLLG